MDEYLNSHDQNTQNKNLEAQEHKYNIHK